MAWVHEGVVNMCFLGFPVILLACVCSAGTPNKMLTYFTDKKIPWNDAAELCRSRGSRLLTIDSEDVRLALKYIGENDWSGYFTRGTFWIGLHRQDGEYMWHKSCELLGDYTPWRRSILVNEKNCVGGNPLLENGYWLRRYCAPSAGFVICEKTAGQCTFVEHPDSEVQGITPEYKYNIPNVEECQQACLVDTGQSECWAVNYILNGFVGVCALFRAHSMAEIAANLNDKAPNMVVYVKMCFKAQLNHTVLTVTYSDSIRDNEAWAGCSEPASETTHGLSTEVYDEQTSTTTTMSGWSSMEASVTTTTTTTRFTTLSSTYRSSSADTVHVTTTQTQTTTAASQISPKSVNSSRNTTYERTTALYDRTTSSYGRTTALYDGTTSSYERTTAPYEEPTASYDGNTASDTRKTSHHSSEVVKWTTQWTGAGERSTIPTKTPMPLNGPWDKTVTLRTTGVTHKEDHESTASMSTTHKLNTAGYDTTKKKLCSCHCAHFVKWNEAEKKAFTEKLISSLTLNKSDISSYRRRYESAHDPRPSAQRIGCLGLVLLGVTVGGLFLKDFLKLYRTITCKTVQSHHV